MLDVLKQKRNDRIKTKQEIKEEQELIAKSVKEKEDKKTYKKEVKQIIKKDKENEPEPIQQQQPPSKRKIIFF